ncbi:MAG: hypothetical protein COY69_00940 [Candidatus Magasanikbacteria bacterium CG_4_10_14_0_8_um_filter_32_14]|uniref:Glycerophosphoryl diester phosphodiesterase membrane domain-containing protein n=2 Tax=Candidatus Magasanikiibacteriota TaxID=1752731 RepID=A0A2M7RAQ3_9BACT|nr:MAG: hypothetical protein AUJ23_02480 [Candidatus Magasanikbacteria bacterium CG1_02_32_51]PIY93572.1 MAG: hypothetical protein COY69_00940 [Candidatus Magasanikbacteria bacterium CG_4_10_14_0_8_um_filter_32_14]
MLSSIHNFLIKIFKVYLSTLKNFIPYIMTFFLLFVFVFFAQFSSILFFTLIPGTFTKTFLYFFGLLLVSFFSFMMSIAFIRMVNSHYMTKTVLGFFSNLKDSFFLSIKNLVALLLLGIPAILVYIVYFVGSMGYLSVRAIILLYLGVIFIGILFVFWLSFVLVAIAIENQKGLNAFKSSIVVVKGRVWSVFLRLFIPSLLFYILFLVYNEIFFKLFAQNIIYTILVLLFALFVIPFGAIVPTILYLELKQPSSK